MSDSVKKAYNSKPANAVKNIFTGVGVLVLGILVITAIIFLGPVFVTLVLGIIQIIGCVIIFCLVVILPLWLIGKIFNSIRNKC